MKMRILKQLNAIGINPKSRMGKMTTKILTVLIQYERERRLSRVA